MITNAEAKLIEFGEINKFSFYTSLTPKIYHCRFDRLLFWLHIKKRPSVFSLGDLVKWRRYNPFTLHSGMEDYDGNTKLRNSDGQERVGQFGSAEAEKAQALAL